MKKSRVIRAIACALFLITSHQSIHATILVEGNATTTTATFLTSVLAKVYDHPTATLIVSTGAISNTSNSYAIATVNGAFGGNIPSFDPIAPIPPSTAETAWPTMLTLATSYGNTSPNIGFVLSSTSPATATTPSQIVNIVSLSGATSAQSTALFDASTAGTINANGLATSAVTNIAANANFIFAAVGPNSTATPPPSFGTSGSGIAVVSITPTTLTLTQVPAIPGDGGIKAAPFNGTTPQLLLLGSQVNINPNSLPSGTQLTYPAMVWDDQLQRLYIGYDLQTINAASAFSGSGGLSVTAAYLYNAAGTIAFQQMAPYSAVPNNDDTQIIAVILDEYCNSSNATCYPNYYPDGCDPTVIDPTDPAYCYGEYPPTCYCPESNLSVHRLAVLHASTGPSYLIVNGGNGTRATTGNLIYALPLVDNPGSPNNGSFANKNSALVNGKFVVPAINEGDLATSMDDAAIVGAGPFPIEGNNVQISDLVVVGDTVYASSAEPLSSITESGIFYSQAMFDETGKILRWTPWTKRSFPYNGFLNNSPQVSFFGVDATTGDVWAVDGLTETSVMVTSWDKGTSTSLVGQLNQQLSNNKMCAGPCYSGCFSVLDLDQSTRGFYGNTCSRYALFGGINKVIFAQVSQSLDAYCGEYPGDEFLSPQTVNTDYTKPQNLLATTLLECGAVTTLEYARRGDVILMEDKGNYFYAGTQNGLFVFADPQGNAINVNAFGNLNEPPFSTGMWFKAPNINGSVVDIKTTGNTLYVLTVNSTAAAPLQGTLYRIPFASTVNTMFAPGNIITIAQTMTAPVFNAVLRFTGIQIISTDPLGSTEQVVLATNRGIYQSAKVGGVQIAANQTDANWQLVNNSGSNFYLGIGGMNTSVPIAPPSTVWPFNLQDPLGLKTFNRGSIYQLNGSRDASPFAFVPPFFNSITSSAPSSPFATLDPITYFWSDGGRRFFIINPSQQGCVSPTGNTLLVLPYDTTDWDVTQPDQDIGMDPILNTIDSYNWVQDIGATGIIMAGTNQGVVGLE
jgi:hypothetical protein